MTAETEPRLLDIHHAFAETDFGAELAKNIRYGTYRPPEVNETEWVNLLGADVNNLSHLQLTYGLTRVFINHMEEAAEWIHQAMKEVIFNPETRLGKMFNAIERVGYVRTALRAQEHIKEGTAPDCEAGLKWLVADVLSNYHPAALARVADELPPVKQYLLAQHELITEAFDMVEVSVFANYQGAKSQEKEDALEGCWEVWSMWLDSQDLAV